MIKKTIKYILRAITIVLVVGICGTGIYQAIAGWSVRNLIFILEMIPLVTLSALLGIGAAKLFIWAWED